MGKILSAAKKIDIEMLISSVQPFINRTIEWQNSHPRTLLWILCGPFAFILSILSMATLPFILPVGAGHINHLVLPVVFFPVLWSALLIAPLMMERPSRTMLIYMCLFVFEILVICVNFLTS